MVGTRVGRGAEVMFLAALALIVALGRPRTVQAQATPPILQPPLGWNVLHSRLSPAPTCHGLPATIYVRNGRIVGGPDHGKRYRGVLRGTPGNDVIVGTEGPAARGSQPRTPTCRQPSASLRTPPLRQGNNLLTSTAPPSPTLCVWSPSADSQRSANRVGRGYVEGQGGRRHDGCGIGERRPGPHRAGTPSARPQSVAD